ncbi:unnamed protein product [Symbiodinium sp. CCMP2592]|nr:unnamed protein product [Symbiodinium sp. CCMP2592]
MAGSAATARVLRLRGGVRCVEPLKPISPNIAGSAPDTAGPEPRERLRERPQERLRGFGAELSSHGSLGRSRFVCPFVQTELKRRSQEMVKAQKLEELCAGVQQGVPRANWYTELQVSVGSAQAAGVAGELGQLQDQCKCREHCLELAAGTPGAELASEAKLQEPSCRRCEHASRSVVSSCGSSSRNLGQSGGSGRYDSDLAGAEELGYGLVEKQHCFTSMSDAILKTHNCDTDFFLVLMGKNLTKGSHILPAMARPFCGSLAFLRAGAVRTSS